MSFPKFFSEGSSDLSPTVDELRECSCEGSNIKPLWRFKALLVSFVFALLGWRLLRVLLRPSKLGSDIVLYYLLGPIFPMPFFLHVVLGQSKYFQSFNQELPRGNNDTFEVSSELRVFTEHL